MDTRGLGIMALFGGAAWLAWQAIQNGVNVYAPTGIPNLVLPGGDWSGGLPASDGTGASDYLSRLSLAEDPNQGLYTKNPGSSASGLFQFTKATWTGLGGDWGADNTLAFGGLQPTAQEQFDMAARLTASNAGILGNLLPSVDDIALYAAHIVNPIKAANILQADPSTPLTAFLTGSTVKKNPALGSTVGSFLKYVTGKVG